MLYSGNLPNYSSFIAALEQHPNHVATPRKIEKLEIWKYEGK
jgi:hypothetical protein